MMGLMASIACLLMALVPVSTPMPAALTVTDGLTSGGAQLAYVPLVPHSSNRRDNGYREHAGTNLEEKPDGSGTFVDTLGRLVHYRTKSVGPLGDPLYECDSDGNGTWNTSECVDMPATEKQSDLDALRGMGVAALMVMGALFFIVWTSRRW